MTDPYGHGFKSARELARTAVLDLAEQHDRRSAEQVREGLSPSQDVRRLHQAADRIANIRVPRREARSGVPITKGQDR
ncbi:hypothetical protein [Sphingomonas montanisoli]|uniref:Uncharacterized protein n=1 Tax=Sphingomonas montanisoli TaxID=2606412 RepID=A0A5D9CB59_9SPHN|nr:hypothetical protein [Sphingomonas montanisoli]TZG28596.1 hypothetical protein FYJ91_00100 [Sphingomonas montanisoli]